MAELTKIEQYVIDKVREIRLAKNFSQTKLSVYIGLSEKFVGNVESTKTSDKYNINHLNKIAAVLECSIKDFFPTNPIKTNVD
ncbi:helix-turn-helix domain-containing protein [Pedobacter namyangjuensis]|uniref:helix-turn-helix domain-containing protein n=1 Tax=Pedobacter namyangjuensis TaxID=600626 RepID=UPI0013B42095|nr:helix-turn-helix transcriptional regulator [Pedobacter namyangjuensis]